MPKKETTRNTTELARKIESERGPSQKKLRSKHHQNPLRCLRRYGERKCGKMRVPLGGSRNPVMLGFSWRAEVRAGTTVLVARFLVC